jgi:hypothetical protein
LSLQNFVQWMGDTPWSIALHESQYAYTIVESVHVLTLCIFLGLAIIMDLRLAGVTMTAVPVSQVSMCLLPWITAGFVVMVLSGALLFYAIPVRTYENIFFRIKVLLLILAGVNVFVFHSTIWKRLYEWDNDPVPPARARLSGILSLIFWAGIVVAGRMIAYNWFDKQVS